MGPVDVRTLVPLAGATLGGAVAWPFGEAGVAAGLVLGAGAGVAAVLAVSGPADRGGALDGPAWILALAVLSVATFFLVVDPLQAPTAGVPVRYGVAEVAGGGSEGAAGDERRWALPVWFLVVVLSWAGYRLTTSGSDELPGDAGVDDEDAAGATDD